MPGEKGGVKELAGLLLMYLSSMHTERTGMVAISRTSGWSMRCSEEKVPALQRFPFPYSEVGKQGHHHLDGPHGHNLIHIVLCTILETMRRAYKDDVAVLLT